MSATALMDAWRALVPGFDATRHELQDIAATISGDRATATARVDARHWLRDKLWRLNGHYEWILERHDGSWKVTHMTLILQHEYGDRGLVQKAAEFAKIR